MRRLRNSHLAATAVVILAVFVSAPLAGCTGRSTPGTSSVSSSTEAGGGVSAGASTGTGAAPPTASASALGTPVAAAPVPSRSVPVPAPSGGSVQQVVPAATPGAVTKVELNKSAALPGKVSITVAKVDAITTKATTPGEIAGPALAVHVSIHNGSSAKISVDSAIVTLSNSANVLGQPTTSDPHHPLSGDLAPGASAEGVYVFLIPLNARTGLTLSVEYAPGQAIAQFVGDIS